MGNAYEGEPTMNKKEAYEAIRNGAETNQEIAEYVGLDHRNVGRYTKQLCDDGALERHRDGNSFVHSIPKNAETEPASENADGLMPVSRDYDWDEFVPNADDVAEYIPTNGEYESITAQIDAREVTEQLPHFRLSGPTGSAKTTLAKWLAAERGWPLFTIQASHSTSGADLLGSPTIGADDETKWVDGTGTKALLCSRERPTVVLLDEVNRAPAEVKDVLYSMLDDRATVELEGGRGGETIAGNPLNLVVISTMNEGVGHIVEELDHAEQRRLGAKFEIDYLGVNNPGKESALIADRTPVSEAVAEKMVSAANDVRELAKDTQSRVRYGVPTSLTLEWAKTAYAYDDAGMSDALVKAGRASVSRPFYDDAESRETVENTIESTFAGVTMAELDADPDRVRLSCRSCDWGAWEDEVDDASVTDLFECPECYSPIEEQ